MITLTYVKMSTSCPKEPANHFVNFFTKYWIFLV